MTIQRINTHFRSWFREWRQRWPKTAVWEIIFIIGWAIWVGRAYLNLDPHIIPAGNEFSSVIQSHHVWTRFLQCGLCALWDGSERGGFPAFVDIHGSSLHPLVIITTFLFGVVNGAKISLVACLAIAGLGQLWLGYELQLGRLARLWGAFMVVVAGHLSGKMDLGLFSLVLSITMMSLTFPATIRLARTQTPRDIILLGVIWALLAVSGQGYIQIGFLLMSPAYLILFAQKESAQNVYALQMLLLVACLALLFAAPFLSPLLHFFPNFAKDADSSFSAGQPLLYYVLNLVIDNRGYFVSTELGKLPYPYLYVMFIGWIPVVLAALVPYYTQRQNHRPLLFLAANAAAALLIGSTLPLKWLYFLFPSLAAVRYAPVIGGLAAPCLIGLAMYSLHYIWNKPWPIAVYVGLRRDDTSIGERGINPKVLLIFPLLIALWQGYTFSQNWLYTIPISEEIFAVLGGLKTESLQWVAPPFGEHPYIEPAVSMGLKLSPGLMAWHWKDRPFPIPWLEADRQGHPPESTFLQEVATVPIYLHQTTPYAVVNSEGTEEACQAQGAGGLLTVFCDNEQAGQLIVQENNWSGWYAWRDGERVALENGRWLQVEAPTGQHTYLFRYLPWDVPVGWALFFIGCGMCVYLLRPTKSHHTEDTKEP